MVVDPAFLLPNEVPILIKDSENKTNDWVKVTYPSCLPVCTECQCFGHWSDECTKLPLRSSPHRNLSSELMLAYETIHNDRRPTPPLPVTSSRRKIEHKFSLSFPYSPVRPSYSSFSKELTTPLASLLLLSVCLLISCCKIYLK